MEEAGSFDHFTYWNHDLAPSATDKMARALAWPALAEQIHAAVSVAEVDAALGETERTGEGICG